MKSTITERNNSLKGIVLDFILKVAELWVSDLQDRTIDVNQPERWRKKDWQNKKGLTDLWNNIERYTVLVFGIPEVEESSYREEKMYKSNGKKFPK